MYVWWLAHTPNSTPANLISNREANTCYKINSQQPMHFSRYLVNIITRTYNINPSNNNRTMAMYQYQALYSYLQYIPRNMHTVFALLCFVVIIHWLIFPYPWGLRHRHCGNLTIALVPAKQPWWIWIKTSCEFIMNDCITTTKQSTTKPCAYFLGYTVSCGAPGRCTTGYLQEQGLIYRYYILQYR